MVTNFNDPKVFKQKLDQFTKSYIELAPVIPAAYRNFIEKAIRSVRKKLPIE